MVLLDGERSRKVSFDRMSNDALDGFAETQDRSKNQEGDYILLQNLPVDLEMYDFVI